MAKLSKAQERALTTMKKLHKLLDEREALSHNISTATLRSLGKQGYLENPLNAAGLPITFRWVLTQKGRDAALGIDTRTHLSDGEFDDVMNLKSAAKKLTPDGIDTPTQAQHDGTITGAYIVQGGDDESQRPEYTMAEGDALIVLRTQLATLQARVEALEAALKPFAGIYTAYLDYHDIDPNNADIQDYLVMSSVWQMGYGDKTGHELIADLLRLAETAQDALDGGNAGR